MSSNQRVCVIGTGVAGLCALKFSLQFGFDATAYEQMDSIGGIWVYTDQTTKTDYGLGDSPHSSLYTGLRTNLPKEVMGYSDFAFNEENVDSFIGSDDVLQYLESYTRHFNLNKHIQFKHEVIKVKRVNDEWEVHVHDIVSGITKIAHYDYIFVCNGHYTEPNYPDIPGMRLFKGEQIHSHCYRKPDKYKNTTVLTIGCGPSGLDISHHLHTVAKRIYLSHHSDPTPLTDYMKNVVHKPDVERFTENGAIFKDGSYEEFTHIIYCTGYKYVFRFLDSNCGIQSFGSYVWPLYKHCLNINSPTMALIGVPFHVCPNQMCDLQVRFALQFYTNRKQMPSKDDMLNDLNRYIQDCEAEGLSKQQMHKMGPKQYKYYTELAQEAEITHIKPVIFKIMQDIKSRYLYELETYRNECYRIIDDENFIKYDKTKI